MSVNVQTSLDQHGLTADEQMAVFAYMNRSQQVNAYEVQQHIAVRFERRGFFVNRSGGRDGGGGARARGRGIDGAGRRFADADADADVARLTSDDSRFAPNRTGRLNRSVRVSWAKPRRKS
jgi:hypothetical protein